MNTQPSAVPTPRWATVCLTLLALALPGGLVLLAWPLARRHCPRTLQAIRRALPALLLALAQGCATQVGAPGGPMVRFQSAADAPADAGAFLTEDALEPGDIVLTSMPGLTGAGIELLTLAPVSHAAIYAGDGRVLEAVRAGVGERTMRQVLEDERVAIVLRHPGLSRAQAQRVVRYAEQKRGAGFNFVGVTLQVPSSIGRKLCELPLVPGAARDACIRGMGVLSRLGTREHKLFCSQLVLQAYAHAGAPLADADPRILSPADILHMREGDVSSVRSNVPLRYVGHLKYERAVLVAVGR
jgi:uncharacterized protein YycO